jgi:hypothetical protein
MQLILPVLFGVGAVAAGIILGLLGRSLGIPETATTGLTVLIILAGIGVAVWYGAFGKGDLRLTPEELVVKPLWRAPQGIPLAGAQVERKRWIRKAPGSLAPVPVGPVLEVRGGGTSFSLGATAADLVPPGKPVSGELVFAPDFVLERADLVEVARRLNAPLEPQP